MIPASSPQRSNTRAVPRGAARWHSGRSPLRAWVTLCAALSWLSIALPASAQSCFESSGGICSSILLCCVEDEPGAFLCAYSTDVMTLDCAGTCTQGHAQQINDGCGIAYGEGTCSDTCVFAKDGECDDGREGAISGLCAVGTDCGDCEKRSYVNQGICNDSCGRQNGICEDGRSRDVSDVCDVGTDCTDCGTYFGGCAVHAGAERTGRLELGASMLLLVTAAGAARGRRRRRHESRGASPPHREEP